MMNAQPLTGMDQGAVGYEEKAKLFSGTPKRIYPLAQIAVGAVAPLYAGRPAGSRQVPAHLEAELAGAPHYSMSKPTIARDGAPLQPRRSRRRPRGSHLEGTVSLTGGEQERTLRRMRDHAVATASRHWSAASARNIRSVDREVRWR